MVIYLKWTQEDMILLEQVIKQNTYDGRINWKKVVEAFPGRTVNQIKAQYKIKGNYQSSKVNMVWDYDANLLLAAHIDTYGTRWQFLSEQIYNKKVTQEALRKQYSMIQKVDLGMTSYIAKILQTQNVTLNMKSFTVYTLLLSLNFRICQTNTKLAQLSDPHGVFEEVKLHPIFDQIPTLRDQIINETADQLVFQTFYKKLEDQLQIHNVIAIIGDEIERASPKFVAQLCEQLDQNHRQQHKFLL
ncbi:Myb-like_DNA-binding domain-containing protein [Hexamita inflata]|uniref:Myb-like DNA-binding domain-containing protein n=1 Tax=Hexamita inflata TaxID=28002 RepID=A0AA86Q6U8_9EUKA|nr:Myb-like DNA-binding domain-containing protein [Hexamita inflata]